MITATRKSATAAVMAFALVSAGCSIIPATGPQGADVLNKSEGGFPVALPYALVRVTPEVVGILGRYAPQLSTAFADKAPPRAFRFGIGDIVSVTIFEAAAGGLFTAENGLHAGNFVTIPNQAVDDHGNIAVPYAESFEHKVAPP